MDFRKWYYLQDDKQIGPVDRQELDRLLAEGTLAPDTYVWAEGMGDWRPANQVAEFGGSVPMQPTGIPGELPPAGVMRPTSVTVFGILNIVFGGLGLLCMPVALLPIFLPAEMQQGTQLGPGMKAYLGVTLVIGFFCNILLVATGIGLLNLKRWARQVCDLHGSGRNNSHHPYDYVRHAGSH